jgi:hypothetical protein
MAAICLLREIAADQAAPLWEAALAEAAEIAV